MSRSVHRRLIRVALAVAVLSLLPAVPARAGKIAVEYDREFDFNAVTAFAWSAQSTRAPDEADRRRIRREVLAQFERLGLYPAAAPVQLLVVTHASLDPRTAARTGVELGTLLVELRDVPGGRTVWQARIRGVLNVAEEKREAALRRALTRAFKKFPRRPRATS